MAGNKEQNMKYMLSVNELIGLNKFLCGSEEVEIRDYNILENIIQSCSKLDDSDKYYTSMAAIILYSILREHPFVYNNRETAILATCATMLMNGCSIHATDSELLAFARRIELGELTREEVRKWIFDHYMVHAFTVIEAEKHPDENHVESLLGHLTHKLWAVP